MKTLLALLFALFSFVATFAQQDIYYSPFILKWNEGIAPDSTSSVEGASSEEKIYDSQRRIVQINSTSNEDYITEKWAYNSLGDVSEYQISGNDTLYELHVYNEEGRIVEYYRLFTDTTIHWYFKYQSEKERANKLFLEEIYDENNHLINSTESEVLRKVYFTAKFRSTYFYNSDGTLDHVIVKGNMHELLYTVHYFYQEGKLTHTIKYNKKGKELERVDY